MSKPSGRLASLAGSPRPGTAGYRVGLAALLLAALAIRFTHVDFGLPAAYHPDEIRKARVIEQVLAGEPHTYLNHPGLLLNSVALVCAALRGLGFPLDRAAIVLYGRALVALVGALTILPTAALARTLFGSAAGLFAAAALAFSPLHTIHSRYLKEDVYLTFWVAVGLAALARWLRLPRAQRGTAEGERWAWMALGAAGFAMGSKYVGAVAAVLTVEVWRRTSGSSWRGAMARLAAVAVIPILLTPQLVTGMRQGRAGMYSLAWELQHGVAGGRDRLTLFFFEWPDLGAYFLLHGLGWGLSWPLALLSIAALVVAWRRRAADPALALAAFAAVVWYAVAEATPLKRGGDVERYALPCVPIWVALASGWVTRWRPPPEPDEVGAPALSPPTVALTLALLAWPLGHSLLLTAAIEDDTRRQAARWLSEHGPAPPYRIAYFGDRAYQVEGSSIAGVTMTPLRPGNRSDFRAALDAASVLAFSELESRRYEDFPRSSRGQLALRDQLRGEFPVAVEFRKPFYLKAGFHNPDIEIRLRSDTRSHPGRPSTMTEGGRSP